jgi:hypothetical protein
LAGLSLSLEQLHWGTQSSQSAAEQVPLRWPMALQMACLRKDSFQNKSKFITEDPFTKHKTIMIR